jgi:hypothetical protein
MTNMNGESGIQFDQNGAVTGRIIRAGSVPHNEHGAERCWLALVIEDENGVEHEVNATCAAWHGFLHPSILAMAGTPEQPYTGLFLQTKGQYHNLVALEGVRPPADWADTMERTGIGRARPKSNGAAPKAPPVVGAVEAAGDGLDG